MKNKFDGKEYYDELKDMAKEVLEGVKKEVIEDGNEISQKRDTGCI